jgi:hypothetical protein
MSLLVGIAIAMFPAATNSAVAAAASGQTPVSVLHGTIVAIDVPHRTIAIAPDLPATGGNKTLHVPAGLEEQLPRLFTKERIAATVAEDGATIQVLSVAADERFAVLIFTAAVAALLLIATAAAGWDLGAFVLGLDGRYSNSKMQMALWFVAVIAAYVTAVIVRFTAGGWMCFDDVGIPEDLLVLSGLSALTFGVAKAVTTQKKNALPAASTLKAPPAAAAVNPNARHAGSNLLRDLVTNDLGNADIGDFQMILITLIAVCTFVLTLIQWLGMVDITPHHTWLLPDVDTTLLSLFGIGQGAYLVKKMASNVGEG